jgi:circadian clock protein KaiB
MRLFIAGNAPNSRLARENLQRLCQRLDGHEVKLEIVDVVKDPDSAVAHGIYVTPALQVIEPRPGALVFGNLSNLEALVSLFPEVIS